MFWPSMGIISRPVQKSNGHAHISCTKNFCIGLDDDPHGGSKHVAWDTLLNFVHIVNSGVFGRLFLSKENLGKIILKFWTIHSIFKVKNICIHNVTHMIWLCAQNVAHHCHIKSLITLSWKFMHSMWHGVCLCSHCVCVCVCVCVCIHTWCHEDVLKVEVNLH
jgi:hypothetical protein